MITSSMVRISMGRMSWHASLGRQSREWITLRMPGRCGGLEAAGAGGPARASLPVFFFGGNYLPVLVSSSWPVPISPEKADLTSPTPFEYQADTLIDCSAGLDAPVD